MRVDSHTHFDREDDEDFFRKLIAEDMAVVNWSKPKDDKCGISGFYGYFKKQKIICDKRREKGLKIFRVVGIHPRSIPPRYISSGKVDEDEVNKLLEDVSKEDDVVGIGEIGLEKGGKVEEDIFKCQLMFAQKNKMPVCIHTPRKNKEEITEKTLDILDNIDLGANLVVIDHINYENILKKVLSRGYYAGITISNTKSSKEEAAELINSNMSKRIMINSDTVHYDKEEYSMFINAGKPIKDKKVLGENAVDFFRLKNI